MDLFGVIFSIPEIVSCKFDLITQSFVKYNKSSEPSAKFGFESCQVILAGTLTGVQGDIRCNVLAALSTVK